MTWLETTEDRWFYDENQIDKWITRLTYNILKDSEKS